MKKVLYFFPDNMALQNAGNITRAMYLLKYFSQKGYEVDFTGIKNEKGDPKADQQTTDLLKNNKLATNVYLLPRKPGKNNPVLYFLRYKLWNLFYYWFTFPLSSSIPTFMTLQLKSAFEGLLKQKEYDYIIVSYVYYANLVANKNLTGKARLIMDTHDFTTAQFKYKKQFNLGATFADEINRLNTFDEVWAISAEERYVFSQFCKSQVRLVPMMMDAPELSTGAAEEKIYDLIYVASDNVHNQRAANWFFKEIYPLLPVGINICVIGTINQFIPDTYTLTRVPFAEDLDTYYGKSKIAICPMLSGTGVKVKVIEALSHGLPVVCTEYGTDGLPNKIDNGCLVTGNAATYAHLIIQLLTQPALYTQQQAFARRLFNQYFETGVSYKMLDELFV
jgi:glycosyltransferase involved in cell wall biosynthesis